MMAEALYVFFAVCSASLLGFSLKKRCIEHVPFSAFVFLLLLFLTPLWAVVEEPNAGGTSVAVLATLGQFSVLLLFATIDCIKKQKAVRT